MRLKAFSVCVILLFLLPLGFGFIPFFSFPPQPPAIFRRSDVNGEDLNVQDVLARNIDANSITLNYIVARNVEDFNVLHDINATGNLSVEGNTFLEGRLNVEEDSNFANVGFIGILYGNDGTGNEFIWEASTGTFLLGATNTADPAQSYQTAFGEGHELNCESCLAYGASNTITGNFSFAMGDECNILGENSACFGSSLTNYEDDTVLMEDLNVRGNAKFAGNSEFVGDANFASATVTRFFEDVNFIGTGGNFTFDSGTGNVGIGTNTPDGRFHVVGTINPIFTIERLTTFAATVNTAVLKATRSSNMATGFGPAIGFWIEDDTSGPQTIGTFTVTRGNSDNSGNFELFLESGGVRGDKKFGVNQFGQLTSESSASEVASFHNLGDAVGRIVVDVDSGSDAQISFMNNTSTKWSIGNDGTNNGFQIHNTFGPFDGTSQFTILNGGNVGIGTTNPDALLEIETTGVVDLHLDATTNAFLEIDRGSTSDKAELRLQTAGTSKWNIGLADIEIAGNDDEFFIGRSQGGVSAAIWIERNDDIGIGTTNPQAAIHALGAQGLFLFGNVETDETSKAMRLGVQHYDTDEEPFLLWLASANQTTNILNIGGSTNIGNAATQIRFYTDTNNTTTTGTQRMVIAADGNVGIGVSSPEDALRLGFGAIKLPVGINTGIYNGNASFLFGTSGVDVEMKANSNAQINIDDNNNSTTKMFKITHDTAETELFRVQEDGRVGIGTTSPDAMLHIFDATDSSIIVSRSGSPTIDSEWNYDSSGKVNFGSIGFDDLRLMTNGATRLTILGENNAQLGYVGIGTTAPTATLDVSGNFNVTGDTNIAGDTLILGDLNVTGDGVPNLIYGATYDYNEMDFPTVNLTDANVAVPIAMTLQSVNGVTFDGNLTIITAGFYEILGGASFFGGANQDYGLIVTRNDVELNNGCHSHRDIKTANTFGNVNLSCVYFLSVGDTLALEIEDEATPVSDPSIHDARLQIKLIHN